MTTPQRAAGPKPRPGRALVKFHSIAYCLHLSDAGTHRDYSVPKKLLTLYYGVSGETVVGQVRAARISSAALRNASEVIVSPLSMRPISSVLFAGASSSS